MDYLDYTGRDDVLSGGVRMIPIKTPKGTFRVWTKRVGNNPAIKVLLLHGGPGRDPRVLRGVRQLLPGRRHRVLLLRPARLRLQRPAGRAGAVGARRASSRRSSRCARRSGSTRDNFYLLGHSWGGILAIEYALKYQQHLQGARSSPT